ncbi:MAG TPA: hypothetical protein RMF84_07205 [Polyangiaceae bacterium LLY-WYZ-14_1]|nr:hypothetical protein [Polyangiaceae bacterium LLY-WYZ-14_1]
MRALRLSGLTAVALGVAAVGLVAPYPVAAQETLPLEVSCGSRTRCTYPVQFTTTGGLAATGDINYVEAYLLSVNGETYDLGRFGVDEEPLLLFGTRLIVMPPVLIGDFQVSREIYVPSEGAAVIRYLDIIENFTTAPRTVDVSGEGLFSAISGIIDSSSDDTLLSTEDLWFIVDDEPLTSDSARSTVFAGVDNRVDGNLVSAISQRLSSRVNYSYAWTDVRVEGSSRAVFMTYGGQRMNPDLAAEDAADMTAPDLDSDDRFMEAITFDLDRYVDDIVNFNLTGRDDPEVRWETPRQVDEGDPFTASVQVFDPNGGAVSWSWDLDDDGEFGENPNTSTYELVEAATDGTANFPLSVRAVVNEGTPNEISVDRTVRISIRNVAPTIVTEPSLQTTLGSQYTYVIRAEDPAGENDELEFIPNEVPDGTVIERIDTGTARLRWTPSALDITGAGETILFNIIVSDGDGGSDSQTWELIVLDNRPPNAPEPIFPVGGIGVEDGQPRLAVRNARDSDLTDRLVYFFELDTVDTFEGVDLRQSGPVAELPGFTFWFVEPELPTGRYFWRAQASDGSLASDWRRAEFWVVEPIPDAGPQTIPDASFERPGSGGDSNCSVGGRADARGAATLLGLVGLGLVLARRRSRRRQA